MSEEKFIKSINKMMDDSSKLKVQGHSGRFAVIKVNNLPIGIIWASKETLMHECLHATRWALDGAGLFLTSDSEECYAYYQNFLFKCASLYKGVKK